MPAPANVQPYIFVGIGLLVTWRVYARIRRLVGRQRYRPVRAWISALLFPVLLTSLLIGSLHHPASSLAELVGLAVGVGLGFYGLRLTTFEKTGSDYFYTPSAHLGIGLSLLFVGRLAYKLFSGYNASAGFTEPPVNLVRSPLTLLIIGTLAGYYATYAIGLILRRRRGTPPWTPAAIPAAEA